MSADEPSNVDQSLMHRREVLRRAAWLLGGAISAPAALAILQGCSAKEQAAGTPTPALKFLNAEQYAHIADIAEIIIPKTDTSGAKDAGVPGFIDLVLSDVYPPDAQSRFNAGYAQFHGSANAEGPFLSQDLATRTAFVKKSLDEALAGEHDSKPFMLVVRELTLLGFFTSKVGITENMQYEAVPTAFHGCVPLSQMKKHVYWE